MFESFDIDWGFLLDHTKPSLQKQFDEWLYGDWNEQKYKDYKMLNSVPIVRDYMDYMLSVRSDNEYLRRYGMDYSDIHDPRKLSQSGSSSRLNSHGYNMISRNISKLYS